MKFRDIYRFSEARERLQYCERITMYRGYEIHNKKVFQYAVYKDGEWLINTFSFGEAISFINMLTDDSEN